MRLLHLGYSAEEIARMPAISKPTVYACYHRWEEGGVDGWWIGRGVADRPRCQERQRMSAEHRFEMSTAAYSSIFKEIPFSLNLSET